MYIQSKIQDLRIYCPMVYFLGMKKGPRVVKGTVGAGYFLTNWNLSFFLFLLQIITK